MEIINGKCALGFFARVWMMRLFIVWCWLDGWIYGYELRFTVGYPEPLVFYVSSCLVQNTSRVRT